MLTPQAPLPRPQVLGITPCLGFAYREIPLTPDAFTAGARRAALRTDDALCTVHAPLQPPGFASVAGLVAPALLSHSNPSLLLCPRGTGCIPARSLPACLHAETAVPSPLACQQPPSRPALSV